MRSVGFSILASVLLVHAAPAQSASYTYFGAGCSFPSFTATALPTLGGSFSVQTWGSYGTPGFFGSSSSVVLTGLSNQTWNGVSLPYVWPSLNPCGAVLVSPDFLVSVPPSTDGTGLASVAFAIPNDASLAGFTFFQQVARLYTSCGKMGCMGPFLQLTVGGQGVIGY